ncbi:helix-turn-helix transcriptional regulator [Bradyrhizobium sp. LHD-71]|uniref:helix-turn-helix domain-containing protein n=1 Tax=Bradyrhizobium sp. LHD-71 TaxID=3072141 RepID=UPI00280F4FAE|nr:helix-turn-helix transcriptional regulator [Bradyrhizobium sp. LHD-71]MDQ8726585.1 helix-turn-helix transcriptional regulator [Bradyrhizobium sp. LHD-71]
MAGKAANEVDVAVGARIRNLRLRNKLSQEEVGRRLNVSFQQVQKYEKGTNRVGAGRLSELAKLFEVPVGAFFSETAPAVKDEAPSQTIDQLTVRNEIRLLEAYQALGDKRLQNAFVSLAEELARVHGK